MKKILLFVILHCSLFAFQCIAQPGQWTWMNGSNTINSYGHYGTKGVFAANNSPTALYEACEWTDKQGNCWLFGGEMVGDVSPDLFQFNPYNNRWAWIKGTGIWHSAGVYGVQGMPDTANHPGARGWGITSWTDTTGNLWMFGGQGYDVNGNFGNLNDLWMYTIATNTWTWMNGANTISSAGNYGAIGVPSALNQPPAMNENSASWTDDNNNLWMYGGFTSAYLGALWKYNIATNQWTWMSGSNIVNQAPVYGTKGVPSLGNTPGGRRCYTRWKDSNDNLWLLGGLAYTGYKNDLWKYNISSNMWTWMSGESGSGDNIGVHGAICEQDTGFIPAVRFEARSCWTRDCDNLQLFGGDDGNEEFNDLWNYNIPTNKWSLIKGTTAINSPGNYGQIHISNPSNIPPARMGSLAWRDRKGFLWMFGGMQSDVGHCYNDMWRFVPDACCSYYCPTFTVTSDFYADPLNGCSYINFYNASINASTCLWYFGDGDSSTVYNPIHNYSNPGTYSVTLIVYSNCGGGIDTAVQVNYITILPNTLPSPVITPSGVTTFCFGNNVTLTSSASQLYLWSTGATTQSIIVNTTGSFSVTITDTNGCAANSTSISVFVNPLPHPVVTIVGSTAFCAGDTLTMDAGGNFSQYFWSTGATVDTIIALSAGNYIVTVTDTNGCINTASHAVTVNSFLYPVITASGITNICVGDSVRLDAGNFPFYNWSNGATTESIYVLTAGTYTVTVTNTIGCTGTATRIITSHTIPIQPLLITGSNPVCYSSFQTYTIAPVNDATSYSWTLPNGWTGSSTTISINAIVGSSGGTISVSATNICGSSTPATLVIIVDSCLNICSTIYPTQCGLIYSSYPNTIYTNHSDFLAYNNLNSTIRSLMKYDLS